MDQPWLSEPTLQVVLDGQASDLVPVLSGVPQGSVLGPIHIQFFINDLPENIRSSVRMLADDCVLYRNIYSIQDCLILQEVRKRTKIRNRYNKAPHLTQDTNGKVTTSQ